MSDTEDLEREARRREAERERDRQEWERKQEEDRRKMPRVRLILAMLVALITTSLAIPTMVAAAEVPTVDIGTPAVACTQDNGLWRIYGHLVFVMEYCTEYDASGQDSVVVFMDSIGNPKDRCDHWGGRFEFIGNPNFFNLKICWDRDHIIVPGNAEVVNALGSTRCSPGQGYWRLYEHLVFVLESCTSYDVARPDSLVIFMDPNTGNPVNRCLAQGGRYERIGNPASFNLTICWDVRYGNSALTFVNPVWDGVTPRVCVDIDGGPVNENQGWGIVSYAIADPKLNPETTDSLMAHLNQKFAPWNVVFMLGECLDANSATIYITTQPAAEQPAWANADDGYAYISGFGKAGYNVGFAFTRYANADTLKAVTAHEIGHLFGLKHPMGLERTIMGDPHDWNVDWGTTDAAFLDTVLVKR